ncbi:MAG: hypothetical protein GF350_07425 [Chitinivibrionales bacterium]|nr:hypothetical protein [Chitinivibrionales bacterium]
MNKPYSTPYRILVADDEEQTRYCINLSLQMKGYAVDCVTAGEKGGMNCGNNEHILPQLEKGGTLCSTT